MTEKLTIPEGTKVRIDGESYALTESVEVGADPVEPKPKQANRHKAFSCQQAGCVEQQRSLTKGAKPFTFRSSSVKQLDEKWILPTCGKCGAPMVWNEEDGETIVDEPPSKDDN